MVWATKMGTGDLIMGSAENFGAGTASAQTLTGGRVNAKSGAVLDQVSSFATLFGAALVAAVASHNQMAVTSGAMIGGVNSAPTTAVGCLQFFPPSLATSASVGSAAALPATTDGFLTIVVSTQQVKIPFYKL